MLQKIIFICYNNNELKLTLGIKQGVADSF